MSQASIRKIAPAEMPDPDKIQREASDPKISAWVSASAGSGKTTVLVNRVLRLLLSGVEPQKILCLTYTRAAAAEMANRVSAKLAEWAVCSEDELRVSLDKLHGAGWPQEYLTEARRLFATVLCCPGGMRIRTIHAFCQEILRRFPIEAGLAPHFAIIEETDTQAMLEDVQADVLRAASAKPESAAGHALADLTRDLSQTGFEKAVKTLIHEREKLAEAVARYGGVGNLTASLYRLFDLDAGETRGGLLRAAVTDAEARHNALKIAQILLDGSPKYSKRSAQLSDWLWLTPDQRIAAFDTYYRCFFTERNTPFADFADKKLLSQHPEVETLCKDECVRLERVKTRLEALKIAEATRAVLTLGLDLLERFRDRKAAQALLDYDDLVIAANDLLHRAGVAPWVLYKLDGGIDHILIDEAQDTSRAQWSIIAALSEEFFAGKGSRDDVNRTVFVVGDEKQSIFSFQHADPAAFAEQRLMFETRIRDAEKVFKSVPMHMSYRSAPAILKAVDAVFAYDEVRQGVSMEPVLHYAAKPGKAGRVEVWEPQAAKENEKPGTDWVLPPDYESEHDPQVELADQIAAQIRQWIDNKEMLAGANRPIAEGDVMILLRRRGRFADLMVRALKKAKLSVTGVDRMKLVQQLPVMDLLALMQFALLPEDDLTLATVLRGPLLNMSEEHVMDLAIRREGSLWQSLKTKAEAREVFAQALDYLQGWLAKADFLSPMAMLTQMLDTPCPGSAVGGRQALWARLGPDALDPIDELLNAAQDFGARHAPSLQSFLHWLTASDTEIKRELDRGGGQVRIMTVHAAKGLEAPIVFLPDTSSVPRKQDMPKLLWDDAGIPLYLAKMPKTGAVLRIWERARRMQMEEYRRLLYVALTRAAGRLYIGGWTANRENAENAEQSWYALTKQGLQDLSEMPFVEDAAPQATIAFVDQTPEENAEAPLAGTALPETRTLPAWTRMAAPVEEAPAKILAPSRLAAEADRAQPPAASPDNLYARGRIIHRLLESLPEVEDAARDIAAVRFLAQPRHGLKAEQQIGIKDEVLRLLRDPRYAPLFGPGSRAEVPLSGWIGGQPVSGQVDRLCVRQDEVWIVDYKSNRPPPRDLAGAAPAYIKQLAAYRALLREVYPDKAIRCFLLWTYQPMLMPVPDGMLDGA